MLVVTGLRSSSIFTARMASSAISSLSAATARISSPWYSSGLPASLNTWMARTPGHGLGRLQVQRLDAGRAPGRVQHLAPQHSLGVLVVGVLGPTGDLQDAVDALDGGADVLQLGVEAPGRRLPVGDGDLDLLVTPRDAQLALESDLGLDLRRHGRLLAEVLGGRLHRREDVVVGAAAADVAREPLLIWVSVGCLFSFSSDLQAITMPGVQKPHWRASCCTNASWIGSSLSPLASPSMVVIFLPTASTARVMQLVTSMPSRWTLQAAAGPAVTDLLGAGQVQLVAQGAQQSEPGLDLQLVVLAVHVKGDRHLLRRQGLGLDPAALRRLLATTAAPPATPTPCMKPRRVRPAAGAAALTSLDFAAASPCFSCWAWFWTCWPSLASRADDRLRSISESLDMPKRLCGGR